MAVYGSAQHSAIRVVGKPEVIDFKNLILAARRSHTSKQGSFCRGSYWTVSNSADICRTGVTLADPELSIEDLKQFGYHLEVPGLIGCDDEGFEV